jgi:medium-chain acyl-[acyl-carrier-protein] hydrolase
MSGKEQRAATKSPFVLIAFPPAGNRGGIFANLRRAAPDGVQVIVPDLPGRGKRMQSRPDLTITDLAAELADELPERIAARPYMVFGTSFGSILSFEYVRETQRRRLHPPEALIVSGRPPPEDSNDFDKYAAWTDAEILSYLVIASPDGVSLRDAPTELQDLAIEWFRSDIRLGTEYRYIADRPLEVPIIVFHGADDYGVSEESLMNWQRHTTGKFAIRVVAGGHFFYVSRPETLIAALQGASLRGLPHRESEDNIMSSERE